MTQPGPGDAAGWIQLVRDGVARETVLWMIRQDMEVLEETLDLIAGELSEAAQAMFMDHRRGEPTGALGLEFWEEEMERHMEMMEGLQNALNAV